MSNVCVLIPSYNEAGTIGEIARKVKSQGLPVYVVDDGSSDRTAAIAFGAGAIVVRHARNMGKGASLREGFGHIMGKGFDAVIVMDGDGQHEADSIPAFMKAMESSGADIVIGNRMLDTAGMPYVRLVTNRFMSYLISKMCGQHVPDTQCGYKIIKVKALEDLSLDSSNFEIESELLIKAGRKGLKISSVPIKTVYQGEKSRINPILDTLRFIAFLVKMGFNK